MTYILIPVFNDWISLEKLLLEIDNLNLKDAYKIIVINDSSTEKAHGFKKEIEIVNLRINQGHQKAICVGLNYIFDKYGASEVIIMDSDGEDIPRYINDFLSLNASGKEKIIFAKRTKRKESFIFKLYYLIFKRLFGLLTGKEIGFGNFCLIPKTLHHSVCFLPDIWVHFAAGIIKSRLPYLTINTERGIRYFGKSKMNFTHLVIHGLSAISVFLDIVFVRLLIFSSAFFAFLLSVSFISLTIKLVFEKASPGWTTTIMFASTILVFQVVVLLVVLSFQIINNKSKSPDNHYEKYKFLLN